MKTAFVYNNPNRKINRKYLRNKMTEEEKVLWSRLRKKQLGYIVRRQYSIGPYIVDFYCPAKRLVVEIDGLIHNKTKDYDLFRTQYLNSLDIQVIRCSNNEIRMNIDQVLDKIRGSFSPSNVEGDQEGVFKK